jgi:predicted GNAT family acetyltransferase
MRSNKMTDVIDDRARGRFELTVDGQTAVAVYTLEGDKIIFTHTEVPSDLEGQGVGSRLVAGALAQAYEEGLRVVPACSFVAAYLRRHPDAAILA